MSPADELKSVTRCNLKVWECGEAKRYVRCKNHYQPAVFGEWNFKPQCLKCGRIGTPKKDLAGIPSPQICSEAEALSFESAKKQKRESLGKQITEAYQAEYEQKKLQWWADYERHLKSDYWANIRSVVLARDNFFCQSCLKRKATDVHHLTYKHVGCEPAFDLVSVCRQCHELLHQRELNT